MDVEKAKCTQDTRRTLDLVYMFRYNQIPDFSRAVIASGSVGPDTYQVDVIRTELQSLQSEVQNRLKGNQTEGNWLVRWVEGEIDEYNWEMHLKNLRLEGARFLVTEPREIEAAKQTRLKRAAAYETAFEWHKAEMVDAFDAAFNEARAAATNFGKHNAMIPTLGSPGNIDSAIRSPSSKLSCRTFGQNVREGGNESWNEKLHASARNMLSACSLTAQGHPRICRVSGISGARILPAC